MKSKNVLADSKGKSFAFAIVPAISTSALLVPALALLAAVLFCAAPMRAQVAFQRYAARFDASQSNDSPSAITADAQGNVYVTGQSCVDIACVDQEALTIKYDPFSNVLWKAWLKSPVGVAQGVDIAIDSTGNTYVLFLLWQKRGPSNQLADPDVVTAKYNAAGVRQWINYLSSTSAVSRTPVKLSVSPAGDVYVTSVAANIPANTKANVLTIKYVTTGQLAWAQVFSPPASDPLSAPIGIQQDTQENVYVLVKSSSPTGSPDSSLILKYSSTGTLLKSFGSEQFGDAVAFQVSPAGNSYAVGFAPVITAGDTGNVTLAKFNSDGSLAWSNNLGSTTESPKAPQPVALALDPKEDVFLGSMATGTILGCGGSAATSIVATKFNTQGTQQWSSTYADANADSTTSIVANSIGDLYVVGRSSSAVGSTCVPQILTVKFGIPGNVIWTERYTADSNGDSPAAMTIGGRGGLFITGTAATSPTNRDWVTLDYVQDGGKFSVSIIEFVVFPGTMLNTQTASVINVSEEELTGIVLNSAFDLVENDCTGPLAPGASCEFTVGFQGSSAGNNSFGEMFLRDNWTAGVLNLQALSLVGIVIDFTP